MTLIISSQLGLQTKSGSGIDRCGNTTVRSQRCILVCRSKKVGKNLEIIDNFAGVRYRIDTERLVEGGSAKLRRGSRMISIRGYPDREYR
jgi:hypothetical protein